MLLQFKTVFYLNIFKKVIYSCDNKAEFSASLLQSCMTLQKSNNMLICSNCLQLNKHFLLLSMLKTVVLLNIFEETISMHSLMNRKFKRTAFIEM